MEKTPKLSTLIFYFLKRRTLQYSAAEAELYNWPNLKIIHDLGNIVRCFLIKLVHKIFNIYTICINLWLTMKLNTHFKTETNTVFWNQTTKTKTEIRTEIVNLQSTINITILIKRNVVVANLNTVLFRLIIVVLNIITMTSFSPPTEKPAVTKNVPPVG